MSNPYAAMDPEQSGRPSAKRTELLRRVQIVTAALIMGSAGFMGIALLVAGDEISDQADVIAWVGIAISVVMFFMHLVVPGILSRETLKQIKSADFSKADAEQRFEMLFPVYMTRQIVACAMLEGAAFLNLVFLILSGFVGNLIAAVLLIGLLASRFPTASKLEFWVQDQTREIEMRTDFAS